MGAREPGRDLGGFVFRQLFSQVTIFLTEVFKGVSHRSNDGSSHNHSTGNTLISRSLRSLAAFIFTLAIPVFCWSTELPVISVHSLQVYSGHNQQRDDNLAGVVHRGNTIGAEYEFTRRTEGITRFTFSADYSPLIQSLEFERESFSINSQLQLSRLFSSANWRGLYLGGAIGLWNSVSYYPYWDEQHVFWSTSAFFSLVLRYDIHNNGTHIFGLQSPLVSMVSRPIEHRNTVADDISFSGFFDSFFNDFEPGTPDNHYGLSGSYEYNPGWLKRNISVTASFNYQRVTNNNSRPFKRLQLLFGTKYTF